MLKLIPLIMLFCGSCPDLFSEEAYVKQVYKECEFKRLFFEGHSYLTRNHAMIHDPDCGCFDRWISTPLDNGAYMIRRMVPSDYD